MKSDTFNGIFKLGAGLKKKKKGKKKVGEICGEDLDSKIVHSSLDGIKVVIGQPCPVFDVFQSHLPRPSLSSLLLGLQ